MRLSSLVPLLATLAAPAFLLAEEQTTAPAPVPVASTAPAPSASATHPAADATQMIVTADRTQEPLARSIASTDVVTAEDVRERGYQPFIHDWLRGLPGVDVNQSGGGFSGITQVRLRGAKAGETRFMRDGIPMTDASVGDGSPQVELFDPSGIQQVEVVRGAQSGLYGSNANGGVVNLIGIRPTATPHAGFQVDAGSHATVAGSAQATGPISEGLGFALNASGLSSEGFSNATDPDAKGDPRNHEKDSLRRVGAGGRVEARNERGMLYLAGNLAQAEQAYDDYTPPLYNLDPEDKASTQSVQSWRLAGGGEWRAGEQVTVTADAARTLTDRTYPNAQFTTKDYHAEDIYAGTQAHALLPHDFSTTLGLDGSWQHAELVDDSGATQIDRGAHIIGLWATVAYDLPWLTLSATGRHDDHTAAGGSNTGRLGAATFAFDQQYKFFGSLSNGFRAPTLYELYAPGSGNPDLQPQTSQSADLGQTITVHGTGLAMTNTWFLTRYQDAITFAPTFPFQSINLPSDASVHGLENAFGWSGEWLALDGVYTWQHSDDGSGQRLAQLPDHKLNLSGTVHAYQAWLRLALERQWSRSSGGQELAPYTLLSASIGWEFTAGWEVYARAENLTDADYEIYPGYATARRAAYAGIAARF